MLNGRKRWIGNATFADIIVIWARSSETKQASLSHMLHKLASLHPCTLPCLLQPCHLVAITITLPTWKRQGVHGNVSLTL